MHPSTGLEFPGARALGNFDSLRCVLNRTDAFDLDSINFPRQARGVAGFDGEEQLKIFATVKRKLEWIQSTPPTQLRHTIIYW